jgi:alpha-D-xyloside xylohydrolase
MREFRFATLNRPIDVSEAWRELGNTHFNAESVVSFDSTSGRGCIRYQRYHRKVRFAFGEANAPFEKTTPWEFPGSAYDAAPELPFQLSFVTSRTIRLRMSARKSWRDSGAPLTLVTEPEDRMDLWRAEATELGVRYTSDDAELDIRFDPFCISIRDSKGRELTHTQHFSSQKSLIHMDMIPVSFVRKNGDMSRQMAASFSLSPDEKLFGCGESFTRLNKRGQRIVLGTNDAYGAQTSEMYKPVPFFLSSEGYGMFVNASAPLTFDFGHGFDEACVLYSGDDFLDVFIFVGSPKEVLEEYTALTGRSPVPPLWSFGMWMSRITYNSEDQVRRVAQTLREKRIPCDVIHIDTGWFEEDWCCDYQFSTTRFKDPKKMLKDLREQGFRVSLWQLPYFTPKNRLYNELIEKGYAVKGPGGDVPAEDAVLDFSNPEAVKWYQGHIASLIRMGVAAIKADFGEAAPWNGLFESGRTGFYEHNLYPLRYSKAVYEAIDQVSGEPLIWARSAWAGSQRYPIHWGGDAENSDCGMAATLRAGLSFGLCGFTYWSHDVGGFPQSSPRDLYRRWTPFGMLTSHTRLHGAPPTEPWEYGDDFVDEFRKSAELRYRLMPYIYAQAVHSSQHGYPMVRALFFEYPSDPTSWFVEDEYMFGSDILVAPLMEAGEERSVYLPPGAWIDYQTGRRYEGEKWHTVRVGEIPAVIMVRGGALIPHIELAQSTAEMDWSRLELVAYHSASDAVSGLVSLPSQGEVHEITATRTADGYRIDKAQVPSGVEFTVTSRG